MNPLAQQAAVALDLGEKPLGYKLDFISALLVSVRDAHADTMSPLQREEIGRALAHLGQAGLQFPGCDHQRYERKIPVCERWHHYAAQLKPAAVAAPQTFVYGDCVQMNLPAHTPFRWVAPGVVTY